MHDETFTHVPEADSHAPTRAFTPDGGDPGATGAHDGETVTPASSAPPTVPGYEILGELGRGGMGVVYKARQLRLNRDVALKMILSGGHASSGDVMRFVAEAEAAAAIQHSGIVQVYESGQHDGLPYFALEYCPSGALSSRLTGTPLLPQSAAELVEQLARAVQAAHEKGIVHRDLKPANVLYSADGTPKVGDFGLARRGDSGSGLTQTGAILGTPSYMAPEQARGQKEIGPAADTYSLGTILYECLTGRPPFRAATALETILQVQKDEPVPPSRLVPRLPRDIETICLKCLAKEPHRRYTSARALANDLRAFLENRTVTARPVGVIEKTWKAAKRRPAAAAAIGAAVLAVVSVVTVVLVKNAELQRERDKAVVAEREENAARVQAQDARATADQAKEKAEGRLELALDAVERMMVRMAGEKWARNPALQGERRAVLEEAIALFRGMAGDDSKDPRVRRRMALTAVRLGTAYFALSDYAKASESLGAAEKLQSQLVAEFPNDAEYPNDLAQTLIFVGHIHVLMTRFEPGLTAYTRAVEQARRAVAIAPGRADFKLTLVETLTSLGHSHAYQGPAATAKYHAEALTLARELTAAPNPSYGARLFLAVGLLNAGVIEMALGRPLAGVKLVDDAETAFDRLKGQPAPSARWADLYDLSRAQLLVFQSTQGVVLPSAAAHKKLDEAMAIIESLLAVQPRAFTVRFQKLNALLARADVLRRWGEEDGGKSVREAVELAEAIARDTPEMSWVLMRVASHKALELVRQAQKGNVADLEKRADAILASLPPDRGVATGNARYNVACAYAQAVRFAEPDDRDKWAAKAVAVLEALARDGYFTPARVQHLDGDTDIEPIRDRADYKAFRAPLRTLAPPPRPVTSR